MKTQEKNNFINLHQHSDFSKLDAVVTIEDIVLFNKKRGGNAVALTDHGTISGSYELWKTCNKYDVKPIIGIESYYVDDYDDKASTIPFCYSHLIILCKNKKGWDNLKKIHSYSWINGYNKKPRVDYKLLKKFSDGLIVLSACLGGLVSNIYLGLDKYYSDKPLNVRKKAAERRIKKFKKLFKEDFYLELQVNSFEGYVKANKYLLKMSEKYDIKTVITNDSHYKSIKDVDIHDITKCINFRKKIDEDNNGIFSEDSLYIINRDGVDAFCEKWHPYLTEKQIEESCKNTVEISNKIENFNIRPDKRSLPEFCEEPDKELRKISELGFRNKILKSNNRYYKTVYKIEKEKYKKRFEYELKVISDLGFSDYYLIVCDIVNQARKWDIPFNMRGSVCGSLIAFCCGISWIDPLRFDCPFERFLTEDRLSMPDMDMDFARSGREMMIKYLNDKYGEECVAHIINYSKWKPRSSLKGVMRTYGYDFQTANDITKMIPEGIDKWEDLPGDNEKFNQFLDDNSEIVNYAKKMIGLVSGSGVHASGVIVTPERLDAWVPVAYMVDKNSDDKKAVKVTEWDMYTLEELNILKLDFLGLRNLDIVADCISHINKRYDKLPFNDIDTLYEHVLANLDDDNIYEMCRNGDLVGTFQMGTSDGMKKLIMDMVPTEIHDIIVSIALYRTAVIKAGMHDEYVKRKFGGYYKSIDPRLDNVLKDTYGVMVFQEQSMKAAVDLAGFTPTESDHFRKGIKQKDPKKFKVWKDKFINGCISNSIEKKNAKKIWEYIDNFSGYGFNESHATSYGVFAYLTAFLKYYYPVEYMASLLSTCMDEDDKLSNYLKEAKRMELGIIKPLINESNNKFTINIDKIVYPFTAIKHCGPKAVETILNERSNGVFKDFEDFYNRINKRVVNIRIMMKLILAGCFRKFGKKHEIFDIMMSYRKDKKSLYCNECKSRYPIEKFGEIVCPVCGTKDIDFDNVKGKKFDNNYAINYSFGFNFSDNPLKKYMPLIIKYDYEPMSTVKEKDDGEYVKFPTIIKKIKKHVDKNGNEMAFIDLSDGDFEASLTVFSRDWEDLNNICKSGFPYIITAKKNRGDNFLYNSRIENSFIPLLSKK